MRGVAELEQRQVQLNRTPTDTFQHLARKFSLHCAPQTLGVADVRGLVRYVESIEFFRLGEKGAA